MVDRSSGHNDGEDGEEHDILCSAITGGAYVVWGSATGDIVS